VFAINDSLLTFRIAVVANVAGIAMAVVAALFGFIDWAFGIPRATPARATGLYHLLLNVSALVLFAVNAAIHLGQWNDSSPDKALGLLLSGVGVVLTVSAGFFGWSLVQDHHVGVRLTGEQQQLEPAGGTKM
jgi:uncharacterized membrane protein